MTPLSQPHAAVAERLCPAPTAVQCLLVEMSLADTSCERADRGGTLTYEELRHWYDRWIAVARAEVPAAFNMPPLPAYLAPPAPAEAVPVAVPVVEAVTLTTAPVPEPAAQAPETPAHAPEELKSAVAPPAPAKRPALVVPALPAPAKGAITMERFVVPHEGAVMPDGLRQRVKFALQQAGVYQTDLAKQMGVSMQCVNHMLAARNKATPALWRAINAALSDAGVTFIEAPETEQSAVLAPAVAPAPEPVAAPVESVKVNSSDLAACRSKGFNLREADTAGQFWVLVKGQTLLAQATPVSDLQIKAGYVCHERVFRVGRDWFVSQGTERQLVGRRSERFGGE